MKLEKNILKTIDIMSRIIKYNGTGVYELFAKYECPIWQIVLARTSRINKKISRIKFVTHEIHFVNVIFKNKILTVSSIPVMCIIKDEGRCDTISNEFFDLKRNSQFTYFLKYD